MTSSEENLDDPQTWWRRLVDAVASLQAGNKAGATEYLQWIEKHRGRRVAEAAKRELAALRTAPNWIGCAEWKRYGYSPAAMKEAQRDQRARGLRKPRR